MTDQGYSITEVVLSAEECDALLNALGAGAGRAGTRHLMSNPAVCRVANDSRLLAIAALFVGRDPVPFRATLFEKTGQRNWLIAWHQDLSLPLVDKFDAPGWTSWSKKAGVTYAQAPAWALGRVVALRVHLDDSTPANGPLRVIPDSHREGVMTDEQVWARVERHSDFECVVAKGGVIAMRPLLIHASSKCLQDLPRRVLHIEYADALELAPGIRLAIA